MSSISVEQLVAQARVAQEQFAKSSQECIDELVLGLAWAIMEPETNRALSEQAVAETGLGRLDDKITKNYRKTLRLLRDLKGAKTVGVVKEIPELGLTEIARPVGVVGAVTPSTNPGATPLNKTLNSIKAGNAVILAPSPKGDAVCGKVVELLQNVLKKMGHSPDLIQKLPSPVSKQATQELMQWVDMVVVTGSQNNVRSAYRSGTPAIGVGAGNVASLIDETADLEMAAKKIMASKTFDNATSCSSENSVVLVDEVFEKAMNALKAEGAYLLNEDEKVRLQEKMWVQGRLSADVTAKSAEVISDLIGLDFPKTEPPRVLMVQETGVGKEFPFSGEKLCPVLTVYRVADFDSACEQINAIYDFQGKGHSISLHSTNDERAYQMGLSMPACRIIVNQAHCFATGGSFDNGMPFSLSMGCGSWGGNSISDNLNYKHYLNTVKIVRPIALKEPSTEEIFGEYWEKHGR